MTPTPAPSGDGNGIVVTGPYGLKNGLVEYHQHWYPAGGAPTPTPYVLNPVVVNTGYDRVNEIVLDADGSAYYMVAGGDDDNGGGFWVDWTETFSVTGELLSVVVGEVISGPTATPQVYYFTEILGSQGPTPTPTPTP